MTVKKRKVFVRIVASGRKEPLPTLKGKGRDVMYVIIYTTGTQDQLKINTILAQQWTDNIIMK
jgi:hypothetical protein